ncbi:MAG TPA: GAF domain-containing sensor histidine kinase [Acidimicrobiales bacterium]|nr:GAF domain-containing sensor histidine kinase [Acidimicrobiales bacterium]
MRERSRTAEERLHALLEVQQLMARVAREIGPALELPPVLTTVLDAMRSLVSFRGGTICLVDERGVYIAASDPPLPDHDMDDVRIPVGTGLSGRVVSTGRPVYSADVPNDARVNQDIAHIGTNLGMRSYLAVPLVCLGRVIGLLQVDSIERDAFDIDDLHVLEGLAAQVAGAIESARTHEELAELENLKSDFVARVTHELKTPLTIITGFTHTFAARSENLTDEQRTWLARIESACGRLSDRIDELLTATGFEAGMMVAHPEDVTIADVAERVREASLRPEDVVCDVDPSLRLTTDPRVLGHALGLLVDNALKYAGDAVITASRRRVTVWDHGPGIEAARRERVFERFTRGDHTEGGMGLGLSIVRNLATAIGARVELDEAPGGGARFTLVF